MVRRVCSIEDVGMLLRRGTSIATTDGSFGTLADVVVDPITDEVTHLVISPHGDLQQSRVVPMWLTNETDDGIRVELDERHVKELQRHLAEDFLRSTVTPKQTEHEVRFKSVLCHPYFADPLHEPVATEDHRRIPMEDFDITFGSEVVSTNDRTLGRVVGSLVADDHVYAIVVRSGLARFAHDVVVPVDAVSEVIMSMVLLDIDRHQFKELPTTSVVPMDSTRHTMVSVAKTTAANAAQAARDKVRSRLK